MSPRIYHWDVSRLGALKNRRIFLTGGTGFFGKWFLRFFVETAEELGCEVVVLSRDPARFQDEFPLWGNASNIAFLRGDVRAFDFPSGRFDFVIHAATPVGSGNVSYDSPEIHSIIVDGTARILDFAEQVQAGRILHISSGAVYGIQPPDVLHIDEKASCIPVTAYGRGKLRSETLCRERGIDAVIARCFTFVGEYLQLDERFAIGNFIADCLHERPIEVKGDGTPLRSYMHGADLVEWLVCMLACGASGEVYNVGSDREISIKDLAGLVQRTLGSQNRIIVQTPPDRSHRPNRYVPSIRKAVHELGLSMKIDLEEAVRATAQDWKARAYVH